MNDRHILDVACKISDSISLRRLGVNLGIELNYIDTIITNNSRAVTEAAYAVLQKWRTDQKDGKVALQKLREALEAVELTNFTNLLKK